MRREAMHVVLLLDLAAENPIDEATVLAQLPAGAAPALVLRLTDFGVERCRTGTPINWRAVTSAIDRLLRAARGPEEHGRCRYWVAGRAGLPAFFYLGYRLTKKAFATVVNPRDTGPIDVLPLDGAVRPGEAPRPYFACSPWPARVSQARVRLGLAVSSRIRISPEQIEEVMSRQGAESAAIVEAQASELLAEASIASALAELDERVAGIRSWYPRCDELAVFVAGPAALAFALGRAINPNIFPDVQVFQHRDHQYELAYETRPRRRKHTILFLASNPARTTRLQLDEEARDIERELERSQHRDRFELQPKLAVRAMDLYRHLRALRPSVVHFSGHGAPGGLMFHDDGGAVRVASPEDLRELFQVAEVPVTVAVLNACFSEVQAEALLEHVDCVVGMPGPIPDDDARRFAVGFYEALGDRASVKTAFDVGCLAMRLRGSPPGGRARDADLGDLPGADRSGPRLLVRPGVDAGALILARGSE